ncbi:MAG: polysaccharide biosynthesis C-terminal domain-containing protein, partial [Candidatus Omnitrophica bacterium]|nr:polysaccharide biosynthesis C-terminal domain-containing protein [Candidatus Omnitrophota bacterium]
ASWFASGSLSLLSYADRLFHIPYQLFFTGMLQIFFTYWADAYSTQTPEDFRVKSRRDIRNIFFIALLVSGVLYIARTPLVRGVYGFGDFQAEDFRLIASLFGWYILGYAPAVLILLYFRALFVLKKSHVFCIHSWVRMILNIIFNFLFIRIWGLMGIAIATFVVNCVAAILLYRYLKSYWNNLEKGSS